MAKTSIQAKKHTFSKSVTGREPNGVFPVGESRYPVNPSKIYNDSFYTIHC